MGERLGAPFIKTEEVDTESPSISSSFDDSQLNFSFGKTTQITLLDGKFFEYIHEKSTITSMVGICKKCLPKHVEVKGYRNCTSNFVSHLKRKHGPDAIEEYQMYLRSKRSPYGGKAQAPVRNAVPQKTFSPHLISQEVFDDRIVKYFVSSMIPLKNVESPHFTQLLNTGYQSLNIMNSDTLKSKIEECYLKLIWAIKSELQTVNYVSIVVSVRSTYKYTFLYVIANWINSANLQRKSRLLSTRRLKKTENYDHVNQLINNVYSDFSLGSHKIIDTIVENNNNFLKAFINFGISPNSVELEDGDTHDKDDIEENKIPFSNYLKSAVYLLNICATADVNETLQGQKTPLSIMHGQVMEKCNMLWNIANQSKRDLEVMEKIIGCALKLPKETKWNSLYYALKQILEIRDKDLGIKNPIRDYEFDYIHEYLTCTKPIAEALDILQGEADTYYGVVLPCLIALRRKLQKLQKMEFIYCKPLSEVYLKSIETRFRDYLNFTTAADNAIIATLSYPRFKNKWFSCTDPIHHTEIINKFKAVLLKEVSKNRNLKNATYETPKQKSKEEDFFNFGSDSDGDEYPKSNVEVLVSNFLAEEVRDLELLDKYPEIRNVFIKYNTPMPSSGFIETPLPYESTSDYNTYEKRLVLKANLNYNIT